jgi:two-component system phosphate regulon sensor histidine kinase PhoR
MNAGLAVLIWLGTWFLASRLSAMVRDRDDELDETNHRLVAAQQERAQHMLRTTHELKAPFAAIHSNTQLLLKGYCGQLPAKATQIASRILIRCRRLGDEIQEMLQLANLTSTGQRAPEPVSLNLAEAMAWTIDQIQPTAEVRNIQIDADLQPIQIVAVADHVKMLFVNLVANAVNYSNDGGHVRVRCHDHGHDGVKVTVEDDGIGISPQKLPHIFDEYYRTNEAAKHNTESSGLGLAIVRRVAGQNKLRIRVQSSPGVGTKFEVRFPPPVSVQAPDRAGTKGG